MKKILLQGALLSFLALGFVSCESDDEPTGWEAPEVTKTGVYILNNGAATGDLKAGMYLVTLHMADGSNQTIKTIKK